ncbi:hypothetical protein OC835_007959, partial [Tilletia horrida]
MPHASPSGSTLPPSSCDPSMSTLDHAKADCETEALVSASIQHIRDQVRRRNQWHRSGIVVGRPDLRTLLSDKGAGIARQINLHNAFCAAVSPHDWKAHVFDLTTDVFQSGLINYDHAAGVLRMQRLPSPDLAGHPVLHQNRQMHEDLADIATFRSRFHVMTNGALTGLTSRDIIVSGGSVLACLTTAPSQATEYVRSDIDLFVTARTTSSARALVGEIETVLNKNIPSFKTDFRVFRSPDVITFAPSNHARAHGYRKIQVITALNSTPCDIVAHFDLDPVCVFYNLERVFITPRAMRAFWTGFSYVTNAIRTVSAARIL